ncbi:MAG: DNA methyltransferase [Candidatus Odinarchaeota archaeon]
MPVQITERLEFRRLTTFSPNKRLPIHRWFPYLQAFSRGLIATLLEELALVKNQLVLDPFCGVGTTNLTCKEKGINSIGLDVSPLACFVSKVKTRNYSMYSSDQLLSGLKSLFNANIPYPKPDHPIMDKGFSPAVLSELLVIRNNIETIKDKTLREFYLLAYLRSIEDLSFIVRDGAHYRYNFNKQLPRVKDTVINSAREMITDICTVGKTIDDRDGNPSESKNGEVMILKGDARKMEIEDESVDCIITSPPYCNRDNYTAQFKIELFLGGFLTSFNDYRQVTHDSFRSHIEAKPSPNNGPYSNELVDEFIESLSKRKLSNPKNPVMIRGYFEDMHSFLQQTYRVLRNGATMLIVIGNSAWSGLYLEVDKIICNIAETLGFSDPRIWVTRYKLNSAQQLARYGRIKIRESIISLTKE